MRITEHRLAEMWCQLNIFETPSELRKVSPAFNRDRDSAGAMLMIELIIGHDKCLEEWNSTKGCRGQDAIYKIIQSKA